MKTPQAPHAVFLQGPPCAFFSRVARGLAGRGWRVSGVPLCAGDALFWRGGPAVPYRGRPEAWPDWFEQLCIDGQVTDLVLLGEARRYHREAVAIARRRGIRVTATDFGYLRPDWITLEPNGMSGASTFPRDPSSIAALAAAAARATNGAAAGPTRRYRDSALRMAVGDLAYSFANVLLAWRFPRYRQSDLRPHPVAYFPLIGARLLRSRLGARRAATAVAALHSTGRPWFVLPMQLEHDFQIAAYSPFRSFVEVFERVFASFAAHAAAEALLVVKLHPWDPGLRRWPALVRELARRHGIADRVRFIDGGDLDALIEGARGVVTVNSTSGLRALQLGAPVLVLGQAIYDVEGLTFGGGLDRFWREAVPPDAGAVRTFIEAIVATIQVRGTFFSEPGLTAAVEETVERLATASVGRLGRVGEPR